MRPRYVGVANRLARETADVLRSIDQSSLPPNVRAELNELIAKADAMLSNAGPEKNITLT